MIRTARPASCRSSGTTAFMALRPERIGLIKTVARI